MSTRTPSAGRRGTTSRSGGRRRSTSTRSSNTRTVEYEVITPEDADGMFDLLTYQKGGSVLRMLERWLGAGEFRAGVRAYLDRYRLGEHRDHRPLGLAGVGDRQARAPHHGLVDLPTRLPARVGPRRRRPDHAHAGAVRLRGRRPQPAALGHPGARAGAHGRHRRGPLAAPRRGAGVVRRARPAHSVVLDAGGEGFYRVSYPREWRDRLLDAGVLEPLERFSLVDDLWAAVLAGQRRPPKRCSSLARRARAAKTDLVVWRVLVGALRGDRPARRGRRARATAGRGGRRAGTRRGPARLAARPGATTRARASSAACCSTHWGTLVEDPSVDRVRRARRTRAARATPTSWPPRSRSSRARATATPSTTSSERATRRPRPRSSCATSSRSGPSRPRSWRCAPPRTRCPTRSARRTARSCSSARCATASTGRRSGCSCATTGTTCAPASRAR